MNLDVSTQFGYFWLLGILYYVPGTSNHKPAVKRFLDSLIMNDSNILIPEACDCSLTLRRLWVLPFTRQGIMFWI